MVLNCLTGGPTWFRGLAKIFLNSRELTEELKDK